MIMGSSNDILAGPGTRGDCGVVTLVQGRVHLSSLFVALRVIVLDRRPKVQSPPALLADILTSVVKETLRNFVAWGDITVSPRVPPYWELGRAMKTITSHARLVVLQEVFMSVLRSMATQRDAGNVTVERSRDVLFKTLDQETVHIPRIIITPPDEPTYASLNAVPGPQDAAFGNRLVVPDPDFRIINRHGTGDPFSDDFRAEDSPPSPPNYTGVEASGMDVDSTEVCDGAMGCTPLDNDEDDDATALGLGPTWSG